MKVDGIDPLVLNRLREQTVRPEVKEPPKTDPDTRLRERRKVLGEITYVPEEGSYLDQLEEGVKKLNDTLSVFDVALRFQLHQEADRWMIQVLDLSEDQVIREIPPEKILNVVAQIQNLIGVLLDEKR